MTTFLESAADFLAGRQSATQRNLLEAFQGVGLPRTEDEVWRYTPMSEFRLDDYVVNGPSHATESDTSLRQIESAAAVILRVRDGQLDGQFSSVDGVDITEEDSGMSLEGEEFSARYATDAFALLNGALALSTVHIAIAEGVRVPAPIVILVESTTSSVFPSIHIELGARSEATIIECYVGGDNALIVPLGEYVVNDGAHLEHLTYQQLARSAWHVARTTATLARDATVRQSVIGLGGKYNRSRNDAIFVGPGATNELRTTFLGIADQIHDFRSHQFHGVGRTHSQLLSKGAVADHARSVYTGLIEIEKGAKRSDARQSNLNLLLSPNAHADTVPNLDIRENDVACAHASSVGPLDATQLWYLESRGVEPRSAERLLVQGFFNEMTESMPAEIATLVTDQVSTVLKQTRLAGL